MRGIDHQPEVLGDLRVRTSALVGAAAVITALFAPTAVEANTLAAWFYVGAAGALLLGLVFSQRVFASLPDGGDNGYKADVDRYVEKRKAFDEFNAREWVNQFSDIKRKWRITFTPEIVSTLSALDPGKSPYVELTQFIDFTRIRNWKVIEKRTRYFGISMWCFALELAFGLIGLGLAT